jgi:hypothetical protein
LVTAASLPPLDVIGNYNGTETIVRHNIVTGERTVIKNSIVLSINPNGSWTLQESGPLSLVGVGNYGVGGIFLVEEYGGSYVTIVGTLKKGTLKATMHLGDTGGTSIVSDGKITAKRLN